MKQSKRKPKQAPAKPSHEAVAPDARVVTVVAVPAEPPIASKSSVAVAATGEPNFTLGSSCTMREGSGLKSELVKLLNVQKPVVLDVGAVERIDTSALQLLCAFVRDRRARRLTTRWTGRQQVFGEAVEILGLTQALGYSVEQRA